MKETTKSSLTQLQHNQEKTQQEMEEKIKVGRNERRFVCWTFAESTEKFGGTFRRRSEAFPEPPSGWLTVHRND